MGNKLCDEFGTRRRNGALYHEVWQINSKSHEYVEFCNTIAGLQENHDLKKNKKFKSIYLIFIKMFMKNI